MRLPQCFRSTAPSCLASVSAAVLALPLACDTAGTDNNQLIEDLFPFTPNQPIGVIFQCQRIDSNLTWTFAFARNESLTVAFTTDTNQDFAFQGQYQYENDTIRIQMPPGADQPFPNGLDESTTLIYPAFGIVAGFTTDTMACIAIGHDENSQPPEPTSTVHYSCPTIRVQAVSDESNGFDFVHAAVPFSQPVPGSVFRQRDIYIGDNSNPNITRAYGIYRRDGDMIYATFRIPADFTTAVAASTDLPVTPVDLPFDDVNVLQGTFASDDLELYFDDLEPGAGPCTRS